jgi:hypothetical protein
LLVLLNFETRQQKTCASKILLARARKYLHPDFCWLIFGILFSGIFKDLKCVIIAVIVVVIIDCRRINGAPTCGF